MLRGLSPRKPYQKNSSHTLVHASLKHVKWNRHRTVEDIAKSYLSKTPNLNEISLTEFCNVCPKLFCFYSRFSCAETARLLHCLCKGRTTGEPWSHFRNVQEIAPKDCLWAPPSLLFSGYRGLFFPRGKAGEMWNWPIFLPLVSSVRTSGSFLLPHTPSRRGKNNFALIDLVEFYRRMCLNEAHCGSGKVSVPVFRLAFSETNVTA